MYRRKITPRNYFTKAEDRKLSESVRRHGKNWDLVAKDLPGRTTRQCRDRWLNYLCPGLNHSQWTPEEEKWLIHLYHENGPKWVQIAELFPTRSQVSIKNQWLKMQRKARRLNQQFPTKVEIPPTEPPMEQPPQSNDSQQPDSSIIMDQDIELIIDGSSDPSYDDPLLYFS